MEEIVALCLTLSCILVPLGMAAYVGAAYALGVGSVNIPGVARGAEREGKDWSNVARLNREVGEALGAVVSATGAAFGLFGFLLPWVELNVSGAAGLADLGALKGSLTGIAFVVQSFIVGVGLLGVEVEGAATVGAVLVMLSLFVAAIPLSLLALAGIAAGMVAGPLGLIKANLARLARPLLVVSLVSLCATCGFFALVQATVGGVQAGGSGGLFGTSFSLGIGVARGFWVTSGGLLLAIIGAITARTLAARMEEWSSRLASLES